MYPDFTPKFCKQYAQIGNSIEEALKDYKNEVEKRTFPTSQHTYRMTEEQFRKAFPNINVTENDFLSLKTDNEVPANQIEVVDQTNNSTLTSSTSSPLFNYQISSAPSKLNSSDPKNPKGMKIAVIGAGAMVKKKI